MTLTGVYVERAPKRSHHWVAVWKTPKGNVIHETLPLDQTSGVDEAKTYAEANPPAWGN
jgi:hypothetical protein